MEQLRCLLLELRQFFSLWYVTLKFMKIVWHKHNLMVSLSADSGQPGRYSCEVPHEYLEGWGNLLKKLNVIASLVWFLFLKKRFPFSYMLPLFQDFQDNFILVEATSSHFFRVTTSTQQLLFRGSYFFRTAAVFSFFRTVTFSQELFFQNSFFFGAKILQSSHFLRIGSSLRQLLFGTAIFFGGTV